MRNASERERKSNVQVILRAAPKFGSCSWCGARQAHPHPHGQVVGSARLEKITKRERERYGFTAVLVNSCTVIGVGFKSGRSPLTGKSRPAPAPLRCIALHCCIAMQRARDSARALYCPIQQLYSIKSLQRALQPTLYSGKAQP